MCITSDKPLWLILTLSLILALAFTTLVMALLTQFSDPGILNTHNSADVWQKEVYEEYMSMSEDESKTMSECPILKNVPLYYKSRSCKTCSNPHNHGDFGFYKPPKSSHCRVCNNCVRGFDHHCVLLNNCIGRRNFKSFCFFLIFSFSAATLAAVNGIT